MEKAIGEGDRKRRLEKADTVDPAEEQIMMETHRGEDKIVKLEEVELLHLPHTTEEQ